MRIRAATASGDYAFGQSQANFLVNSPAAVALLVQYRLELFEGEWFLDVTDGTPYVTEVLGTGTKSLYDLAIQARILSTPGVSEIVNYSSDLNPHNRKLTVNVTINTIYGAPEAPIFAAMAPPISAFGGPDVLG